MITDLRPGLRELCGTYRFNVDNAVRQQPGQMEFKLKAKLAAENAAIYGELIAKVGFEVAFRELLATDATDTNLGILSGTLVALRALDQLAYTDPLFTRLTSDFSDQEGYLNQTIGTRITTLLPTMVFDPTANGTSGLPNGWSITTAASATDVSVKLNKLVGVPIRYGLDTLSQTQRRPQEFADSASATLSNYLLAQVYALMTPANFNAYANVNGVLVPVAYTTYSKLPEDFGRAALTDLEAAFDANKVPQNNRTCLLSGPYAAALGKDPSIHTFYGGAQDPAIIERGEFPLTAAFLPTKAPGLIPNNATPNLAGFAMQRSAIVLACRPSVKVEEILPDATGKATGRTTFVTNPKSGMTIALVEYATNSYVEWRMQAVIGAAVGNNAAGIVITIPN